MRCSGMTALPLSRIAKTRAELVGAERAVFGRAREMESRRTLRTVEEALVLRGAESAGFHESRQSSERTETGRADLENCC